MNKHTLRVFLPILLMVGLIFGLVQSTSAVSAASEQGLEKVETAVLDALSAKGSADYVVEMAEHADLSAAYEITDWDARGWFVLQYRCGSTAARTTSAR
jgi:hypothetical protein